MADTHRLDLPYSLDAPALARQYLRTWGAHLPAAELDDALIMTSELVTNAVQHGAPDIVLSMNFEPPHITVSVADAGSGVPPTVPDLPPRESLHGRGLLLVDSVASCWGVTPAPGAGPGKSVWFRIDSR